MSESEVIANRKKAVTDRIAKLREELTSLEAELVELEFADNVVGRLMGYAERVNTDDICDRWAKLLINTHYRQHDYAADYACVLNSHDKNAKPIHFLVEAKSNLHKFAGGSPGWDLLCKKQLTLPEKIEVAMRYAHKQHVTALAPKEIENYIVLLFGEAPAKQNVNSVVWRMASKGSVCKADDAPKYWLPEMNKAADSEPREGASTALVSTRAKGREAAPGGGT